MTKKDYFNRCPECGEARMDHLELEGTEITCLSCGHVYGLSFSPHPSSVFPREVYEEMKAKAEADGSPTDLEAA